MSMHEDIHAYVDGQLSESEKRAFMAELAERPDLAEQVESVRNLKNFVRNSASEFRCESTWSECSKRIAEMEKVRRTENFVGRHAWAICASFACLIAVAGVLHKQNAPQNVQNADFVKAMAGMGSQSAPASADRQEMNRWLDHLLGKAREAVASDRLIVKDAAEGDVDGHRISRLHLVDSRGDLWLLAFEDAVHIEGLEAGANEGFSRGRLGDMNCVLWNSMGHTFILSGERTFGDLAVAAQKVSTPAQ